MAKKGKVAKHVRALNRARLQQVAKAAEAEGLHEIFRAAGFEWRKAGCSMCLGMNPDVLVGREMSASSSNRNFIGRQGSPTGRTLDVPGHGRRRRDLGRRGRREEISK